MNMHVRPTLTVPSPAEAARLRLAKVAPLGPALAAVFFDEPATGAARGRLTALLDGAVIPPPTMSTNLALAEGGTRHVLILGRPAESIERRRLDLALGPRVVAALDPDRLQPGLVESAELLRGLSASGRNRLLRLLLTAGLSIFTGADAFGDMRGFLAFMGVREAVLTARARVGSSLDLLSYRLPPDSLSGDFTDLVALLPTGGRRLTGARHQVEMTRNGRILHLALPVAKAAAPVVALGPTPVLLPAPPTGAAPRPVTTWIGERTPGIRRWVHGLIAEAGRSDPVAAATLREVEGGAAALPEVSLRHLSATDGGLLLALDIHDPRALLAGVLVQRGDTSGVLVPPPCGTRTTVTEFLALARRDRLDDSCRLILLHRSGRRRLIFEGRPEAYGGGMPEGLDSMAIAEARLSLPRRVARPRIETFGVVPDAPRLSLVVGLTETLDLARARAALLFAEKGARAVEVICHCPEGRLAEAARAVLEQTSAVFGIAHRLVTVSSDATQSEQMLAALEVAKAQAVLVMGPDILPRGKGWLAACVAAMRRPGTTMLAVPAVAPYGEPEAARSAVSPMIQADCVALSREVLEMLAGFTALYPNPDIVLSEAAARSRDMGRPARSWTRHGFARFRDAVATGAPAHAVDLAALRRRIGETGVWR